MENLIFSLNATVPVFLMMLLGLVFLLAALAIYNSPFGNAKRKK